MRRALLVALTAGAALVSLGWSVGALPVALPGAGAGPRPVEVAAPAPVTIAAEGRVTGEPGAVVTLGSELDGRLTGVRVRELDRVRAGDVLATINVADLEGERLAALARRDEALADRALAQRELEELNLAMAREAASRIELDRRAREIAAAEARVRQAEGDAARLAARIAMGTIASPIDGVVVSRLVDAGEMTTSGQELLTVADLSRLWVEAEVDEFDAGRVRVGMPARVTAEGHEGVWTGVAVEVPERVEPRSLDPMNPAAAVEARVLRVKVRLDAGVGAGGGAGEGGGAVLKLGQRVEVRLIVGGD